MKRNLNYYSHYADSHRSPEFKYLRSRFGWEGEGKFYAIKNLIASAEGCKLDISNNFHLGCYADEVDMTLEDFSKFLDFLTGECKLLTIVDNFVICDDILDHLSQVMKHRKKVREKK